MYNKFLFKDGMWFMWCFWLTGPSCYFGLVI